MTVLLFLLLFLPLCFVAGIVSVLIWQGCVFTYREAGLNLELDQVAVQSLVPEPLQNVDSAAEFMQQLPEYDAEMARQVSDAEAAGDCLRFVGKIHCKPTTPIPPTTLPPPP